MKRLINTLVFIVAIGGTLSAQKKEWNARIETQTGYEANILKNPSELERNQVVMGKTELWKNSFFQDAKARGSYAIKNANHQFRLYASTNNRLYFSESSLNSYRFGINLSYQYFVSNKKVKYIAKAGFKTKQQDAFDKDETLIKTPFSYKKHFMETGIEFRIHRLNRTFLGVDLGYKDYVPTEKRDYAYSVMRFSLKTQNLIKKQNGFAQYGFALSFENRAYNEKSLIGKRINERHWKYLTGEVFYKYPFLKVLSINPSIKLIKRMDTTVKGRASYFQWQPQLKIGYTSNDWKLSYRFAYRYRNYRELYTATKDNIRYDYLIMFINAEYTITKNLLLNFSSSFWNRSSNKKNIKSSSFRGYRNYYIGTGVKWKF